MAPESCRTSVFTFQSSVHSLHVLSCLDEQRRKDHLCDVTVVVENRSFRAHRSVLASCSDYFSARMSSHTGQGLIINLSNEVTVEGFEPLLQFAYTSKLLFTKENVLEIRNCASVLGFKNLDTACFDFLLPKFFDDSKSSPIGPRKRCCKTLWKAKDELSLYSNEVNDDRDVSSLANPSHSSWEKEMEPNCSSDLSESAPRSCSPCPLETGEEMEEETDYCCLKYSKYQACGKDESYKHPELETTDSACSQNCLPCSSSEPSETAVSLASITSREISKEDAQGYCPLAKQSSAETPQNLCSGKTLAQVCPMITSCSVRGSFPPPPPSSSAEDWAESCSERMMGKESPISEHRVGTYCLNSSKKQRSIVEIEVANQLSTWPDVCSSHISVSGPVPEQGTTRKSSELHWPKQLDCPFLRDLGAVDAQLRGSENTSCQAECPYSSSLNSGEDSDSFDTEGDSESGISERASEMQLPYSVERIASMSRNDFQNFLKTYQLMREQLDYVHDVRRRSKNRIAARRCRKRKLDCIHNLECEIEKLRNEKEKLAAEKRQLDQMKLKTWQSYSVLYERLCSEANLQPEQLQVFAKYTSMAECPFSAHLSTKTHLYHCPEPELQPLAARLSSDSSGCMPGMSSSSVNTQLCHSTPDFHSTEHPNKHNNEVVSVSPDQISQLETDKS